MVGQEEFHMSSRGEDFICQRGVVVKAEAGYAQVKMDRDESCKSCASKAHCGALFGGENLVEVRDDHGVSVGLRVEVGIRPAAVLTASIILFIVPAVAFIVGILTGYALAEHLGWEIKQWAGFGFGAILFAGSLLVIKLLSPRFEKSGRYEPFIMRVLD